MKFRLMIVASLLSSAMLVAPSSFADVPPEKLAEVEERKKARSGKAMGVRVGKKVAAAWDLYSEEKVNEALAILLELEPKDKFDKAYVERFIGSMYAGIEGQAEKAIERLQRAKELDILSFTDHASVIKLLADLLRQEKRYEEAIPLYYEYLDFTLDNHADTYYRIANSYFELGKFAEVVEPARNAIKYSKKKNENHYVMVMASYFERKMYPEATKAVEDIVKNFPEKERWWGQLAVFYALIEDYERALSTMNVAYKNGFISKENQYKQLAQLFASNGVPYNAAVVQETHILKGEIEQTPRNYAIMASTFRNAKEFVKAAKYYGEAAKLESNGENYAKQGDMLLLAEKYDEATSAYDRALKAEKKVKSEGKVYLARGEALLMQRRYQEAYDSVNEAVKDKKTRRSAKGWLGFIADAAERNGVTVKEQ